MKINISIPKDLKPNPRLLKLSSFLTYPQISKYYNKPTKLIDLHQHVPLGYIFKGYIYDRNGHPKQFLVRKT